MKPPASESIQLLTLSRQGWTNFDSEFFLTIQRNRFDHSLSAGEITVQGYFVGEYIQDRINPKANDWIDLKKMFNPKFYSEINSSGSGF